MEPDKKQDPLKFTRPRKYLEPPDSFSMALYKNIVAVLEKADKNDLAPETLKALDELKEYIQDCESLVNKYPEDEDLKKAQEILKTLPSNFAKQGELFSYFTPPSSVNIKRDVVVSWVSTKKIKEKYPHLLDLTLAGDNVPFISLPLLRLVKVVPVIVISTSAPVRKPRKAITTTAAASIGGNALIIAFTSCVFGISVDLTDFLIGRALVPLNGLSIAACLRCKKVKKDEQAVMSERIDGLERPSAFRL